jgi:hypothetical protein
MFVVLKASSKKQEEICGKEYYRIRYYEKDSRGEQEVKYFDWIEVGLGLDGELVPAFVKKYLVKEEG